LNHHFHRQLKVCGAPGGRALAGLLYSVALGNAIHNLPITQDFIGGLYG
jgi:hypothetical protein